MPRTREEDIQLLRSLLAGRDNATALELAKELGVSRPTVSRLLSQMGDEVVMIGAARQARYALRREIGKVGRVWPLYRVDERGELNPYGSLEAVQGGFRLDQKLPILRKDYADGFFADIPFIFADVKPQGFLGRVQARQVAASLGVPADPREWTAEDSLTYLVTYGDDLPGDLVIGEGMAARLRNNAATPIDAQLRTTIPDGEQANRYPALADQIIRGETFGSSAGGEQPKFATWVIDAGQLPRAVIVKFSPETKLASGQRWADLLLAEFHALNVLRANGVVTPQAKVFDAGFRRFLEITRYDRIGAKGRRGLISLFSVEAGFIGGKVNNWVEAAEILERDGMLEATDAQTLKRLWCFGVLIGNTDMHYGNVSLWWRDAAPLALAPVYDMLPMVFAPSSQGEIVTRPIPGPDLTIASREDWVAAQRWAVEFWNQVLADTRFSPEFHDLAVQAHARVLTSVEAAPRKSAPPAGEAFQSFATQFPNVAQALTDQKKKADHRLRADPDQRSELRGELEKVLATNPDLGPVARGLFPEGLEPAAFAKFGLRAYLYLGSSDTVRAFMGKLWADVMAIWPESSRDEFLNLIVEDGRNIFEALDFVHESFRRLPARADFMRPWLKRARERLGNDLYQVGYWRTVENFAHQSPEEAAKVIEQWVQANPSETERGVIARLLAWVRAASPANPRAQAAVDRIDAQVRSAGRSEWRALYLESWAVLTNTPALTERKALRLRDELARAGPEETSAWCHLLCSIVLADRLSWEWAYRELQSVARDLAPEGKFWVMQASTVSWTQADDRSPVTRAQWEALLVTTLPYQKEHKGLWNRLESFLRQVIERAPERITELVRAIVAQAGSEWLDSLAGAEAGDFLTALRERQLHESLATELLVSDRSAERQLGLIVFAKTFVPQLQPDRLAQTDARKLELIFREAQVRLLEPIALGRLHSGLAPVMARQDEALQEVFYEEVRQQALSTAGYREVLEAEAGQLPKVKAVLATVEDLWKRMRAAADSPALRMRIPGYARAAQAYHRRFAREVARQAGVSSPFTNMFKTVQLMYGSTWRHMGEQGLSAASPLKTISHSVEIPRMEFVDPEGQNWRRLKALHRIQELEKAAS